MMNVLGRIFSCECECPQKNVYALLAVANVVMLVGSVAGANNVAMRNQELKYLLVNVVVAIVVYLALEWLCENNHNVVAWVIALLPVVAALIHGYRMAQSGRVETTTIPSMVLEKYRLI